MAKTKSVTLSFTINAPLDPYARGEHFEDPLYDWLERNGAEILDAGGGTMLRKEGLLFQTSMLSSSEDHIFGLGISSRDDRSNDEVTILRGLMPCRPREHPDCSKNDRISLEIARSHWRRHRGNLESNMKYARLKQGNTSESVMQSKPYKRFRMQLELRDAFFNPPQLPEGYRFLPWRSLLLERHANVKWRAFRDDLDGQVFACLGQAPGCLALMKEIVSQRTFCPLATWMVVYQPEPDWPAGDCGTIQGITRNGGIGAIQNVGVTPEHRGMGIGRALVIQALRGFLQCGMACSVLEVTAENEGAVKLYRSIGFQVVEVLFRDSATGETVADESETRPRRRWYSKS